MDSSLQSTKSISQTEAPSSGRGRRIQLPIHRVRQINLCGCGLAALEMVLRYYGTDVDQLDFLNSDKRLRKRVELEDPRGLSEATFGVLALKRSFKVTIFGEKLRVSKTFLKLSGRVVRRRTDRQLVLNMLQRGIPPIIKIPDVGKAYGDEAGRIPHYVVVRGVGEDGSLEVADPWYDKTVSREYWDRWIGSIISIEKETPRRVEP